MPRHPDFSRVTHDASLDPFRKALAEIVLDDRVVGYLATQVGALSTEQGGRLWWKKWSGPRETVEYLMTRTDETSALPEFDDGMDYHGEVVEELRSGTVMYEDRHDPEGWQVKYNLRWLDPKSVEALWDRYGFGDTTLL